jgi:dephospho-CoA kinase
MKNGCCVALTGGIACGKSTVAAFWRQRGAAVFDADAVAHELIAPGGDAVEDVLREFGETIRRPEGGVDRKRLGALVFADETKRLRLNALLHPRVICRMQAWAEDIRRSGGRGVAVVPLLFEAGMEKDWDAVICVASDEETILERLAERGLSPSEAQARIASQWPVSQKRKLADRVMDNNGTLAELETQCQDVWNDLFEQGD